MATERSMPLSSCPHIPLDERFTGSLARFMPIVGLLGSAMDCMDTPHSMPVNPESVESNHWKLVRWVSPLESRSLMASTSDLADDSSVSVASFRHLSSPIPAAIPAPPIPALPQLFSSEARCSASILQFFRMYLSRAISAMDPRSTPCCVILIARSEESLLRCSSSRSSQERPLGMPASSRIPATPSTLPLIPRMYGSVSRNSLVIRLPDGIRDPGARLMNPRFSPSSSRYVLRPDSPFMCCLSPAIPAKATCTRSQLDSSMATAKSRHIVAPHPDVIPSMPYR